MINLKTVESIITPKGEIALIAQGTEILFQKKIQKYKRKVQYLESSGTQWINTGIIGTTENSGVEVVWEFSNADANMCIFSTRSAQISNTLTLFWLKTSSNRIRIDAVGQKYFGDSVNTLENQKYHFIYKSKTSANATLNNLSNDKSQFLTIGKLTTFSSRDNGVVTSSIKIYSFKWYEGDILVRDFIPVLDQDDIPCMYDKITDELYYNVGTGQFLYAEE